MELAKILPARIEEYYPETQTADVKISAEMVYNSIVEKEAIRDWQLVRQVPVQTISGGGFAITFPIKKGDTCKICFSQVGYDHWFVEDRDTAGYLYGMPQPHLRRSFSLEDGFCEVGYNTLPRVFKDVSSVDAVWRNKDLTSSISIKEDGSIEIKKDISIIKIEVDGSVTIAAQTIDLFGNVNITGNMNVIGGVTHIGKLTRTLSDTVFLPNGSTNTVPQ